MKDLITTMAAMVLLMVFVMQFAANQVLAVKILGADKVVNDYHGMLLRENDKIGEEEELRKNIALCLGCSTEEVSVVKTIDETMNFEIEAPLYNIIACGGILGISDEENMIFYKNGFKVTL